MSQDLLALRVDQGPTVPDRPRRWSPRRRLLAGAAVVVVALGWIAARGLTGSFVYYLTPTEATVGHKAQVDQRVRLGGYVVRGSVRHVDHALAFTVTDRTTAMRVVDTGSVPEIFRPGQGVVLEGALGHDGRFHADTLLVKHDGTYRAPRARPGAGG
jgi:cytochrome c-type biogenesis protein CcmE